MSWQRVESATVDPELNDGLAARVADPMWLLARQWQVGELRGEDAANPVLVRLRAQSVSIDQWRPPNAVPRPIDPRHDTPLEALVEAEPLVDGVGDARLAAEVAHVLAERWSAQLPASVVDELVGALRQRHPLAPRNDPSRRDAAGDRRLEVLARRWFDGSRLFAELAVSVLALLVADPKQAQAAGRAFVTGLAAQFELSAKQVERVVHVLIAWLTEIESLFVITIGEHAWNSERMEHEFQAGAPFGTTGDGVVLEGRDHRGGRLDWHSFDMGPRYPRPGAAEVTDHERELLPVPLRYAGMPASRFWEMEDGSAYFGGLDAAPEDLARVALGAYATVYGDDWWLVPLTIPTGSVVQVSAVEVLDDFGATTVVPAAAAADGADRAFRFFELTGDPIPQFGGAPALVLPASVQTIDSGRPLDDVVIARDESANLAWAVERRIEGTYGRGIDATGGDGDGPRSEPSLPPADRWVFDLGGDVPPNWVPLLPVRLGDDGAMAFQRGRVPIPGTDATRGARSALLEPDQRLVIQEAEVPDAGLRILRRYQAARTRTGALRVWLGRQKGPGRPDPERPFVTDQIRRNPTH